jgi:hypothetical protein
VRLIASNLRSRALALEHPSQGMSAFALACARRRSERTTLVIKCIHEPVSSMAASPILEIGLGFVLRFLGFLGASRVPLNSINRLVNIELDTCDFGEELTALQRSIFMKMFNIKLMCN